jgi:hypothetical protein
MDHALATEAILVVMINEKGNKKYGLEEDRK